MTDSWYVSKSRSYNHYQRWSLLSEGGVVAGSLDSSPLFFGYTGEGDLLVALLGRVPYGESSTGTNSPTSLPRASRNKDFLKTLLQLKCYLSMTVIAIGRGNN